MKQFTKIEREAYQRAREQAIDDLFQELGLQRVPRRSSSGFPFNLLEQGLNTLLQGLERGVTWAIRRVIKGHV